MTQPERRLKRECLRQKAGYRKNKVISRMAQSPGWEERAGFVTKGSLATVNKSSLCKREGWPQSIHRSKSVGGRAGEGTGFCQGWLHGGKREGGWAARGSSRTEGRLCLFLRMRVDYYLRCLERRIHCKGRDWNYRMTQATKYWEKPRERQRLPSEGLYLPLADKRGRGPWPSVAAMLLRAFSKGSRVWAKHSRTLPKSLLEETMFWLTPLF